MPTRKRGQRGGAGNSYSFGAAVSPGAPYAAEVTGASSCMAAARSGMIAGYSPPGLGGLPGMAGGARRRSKRSKRSKRSSKRSKRQRGGRYMVEPSPYGESASTGPNVFAPVYKLGCEFQGGGGGADLAAYSAPTAGYGNTPSSWVASTGAPVLLQAPYDARAMNPACLKTGGGKRTKRTKRSKRSKRTKRTKRRGTKRKH